MAGLVVPDSSWFFVELLSAHCVRVGGLNCRGMGIQADQLRIQQDFMVAHLVNLCLRNLGLCMGYFLNPIWMISIFDLGASRIRAKTQNPDNWQ